MLLDAIYLIVPSGRPVAFVALVQLCDADFRLPRRSSAPSSTLSVVVDCSCTCSRVLSVNAARNADTASSRRAVALSRSPKHCSATPRLCCIAARSSGTQRPADHLLHKMGEFYFNTSWKITVGIDNRRWRGFRSP